MAYTKQIWADTSAGGTPISAARLNYMENGIAAAAAGAGTALTRPFLTAFGPSLTPAIAGPLLNTVGTSPNTLTGSTYEFGPGDMKYTAVSDVYGVAPVFSNWTVDTPNPNPITIRCSVSNDAGATWRRVLFNGAVSVTLEPDADVRADFCPLEVATGGLLYLRVNVTVASVGMTWPVGQVCWAAPTATDNTMTAGQGWITQYSIYGYGPTTILCQTGAEPVLLAMIGDSIMNGENDWPTTRGGFTQGVTAAGVPFTKLSKIGEGPAAFANVTTRRRRTKFLNGASHILCEYGVNDLAGASTPDAVANNLIVVWKAMAGRGAKVYQTTLTPSTTSTDGYATVANQTARSGYATARVALNNWIRAGAPVNGSGAYVAPGTAGAIPCPYLSGYIEVADTVESARDSSKWKVGAVNTADGLHPSDVGHTLIAPVVQTWAAALT